jgi:hypothetical protein
LFTLTKLTGSLHHAFLAFAAVVLLVVGASTHAQGTKSPSWRAAGEDELRSVIPARAPVVAEHIETEFRTASGITDGKGRFIAGVVLITAGYSAEGKYSHYLLTQVPMKVGSLALPPGQYVFGWTRKDETLTVNFYEAATGRPLGEIEAVRNPAVTRVESFRIWPPSDRALIQLGRFTFTYSLG